MQDHELELQSLAPNAEDAHGVGGGDDFSDRRPHSFGGESSNNVHNGSSRRLRYCMGGFLGVVIVCFCILYLQATTTSMTSPGITGAAAAAVADKHGLTAQDVFGKRNIQLSFGGNGTQSSIMVTPTAYRQIQSFRQGTGLILNIHITHHAGTAVCGALGRAPGQKGAPSFACNGVKAEENATLHQYFDQRKKPWTSQDTSDNIRFFSNYFHMMAWEFSKPPRPPLSETDWEDSNLVSMIVMREPLSRLLAGDHGTSANFPNILTNTASLDEWWAFSKSTNTNNFAMRILAGQGCCQGEDTDEIYLVHSKELLSRFTFVLDLACLTDGLAAVAHSLGFEPRQRRVLTEMAETVQERELARNGVHPPVQERIPFPEVYEFLQRRNRLDIELYEWSKEISLVRCQR